ncbi:MAG: GTPase Era [Balneolaceae bacterium]|jgi:GTP-binding protein Era|nr:MAG: GTPase Era [Balneolaceae bacterium]
MLMEEHETGQHKSGYIAIIGKPNAGKSTLLNQVMGIKLSIATHKPQTTRHRIMGIYSDDDCQIILMDTPGVITPKYKLQEAMMGFVERARTDADIVLHVVDAADPELYDAENELLDRISKPVLLVLNKSDLVSEEQAGAIVNGLRAGREYADVLIVSALTGAGTDAMLDTLKAMLPTGPPFYPKDQLSEAPERFFVSELIREQLFLQYRQEIPYSCAVNIVDFSDDEDLTRIDAEIVVNRNSQKGMIIGKGGQALKKLGTASRATIEQFLDRKIYLALHVKVRDKWRDNDAFIRSYGYGGG